MQLVYIFFIRNYFRNEYSCWQYVFNVNMSKTISSFKISYHDSNLACFVFFFFCDTIHHSFVGSLNCIPFHCVAYKSLGRWIIVDKIFCLDNWERMLFSCIVVAILFTVRWYRVDFSISFFLYYYFSYYFGSRFGDRLPQLM